MVRYVKGMRKKEYLQYYCTNRADKKLRECVVRIMDTEIIAFWANNNLVDCFEYHFRASLC